MDNQTDLFPKVTELEIKAAKNLLASYKSMRGVVDALQAQSTESLTPKQRESLDKYKPLVEGVEKAVSLIQDDDVKRIIDRRYIKGSRWKDTVMYFSSYHESTVVRKLNKGIGSVAETLKLWNW
ncbi:hypothetical protein [Gorillibacterium sp. sgz5001074]|uniref:hypothetical protein n=1 Tax=Gorillibacterium sp. sgz5001074 TaxID=3446695 RepID=UPI003F681F52